MVKRYLVVEDRQGGEFGMGRHYTVEQWIEQAIDWHDGDEFFENKEAEEKFRQELLKGAKEKGDWYVLNYISDMWDIEFEEIKKVVVCEHCGNECAEQELNDYSWHCPECHEKVAD